MPTLFDAITDPFAPAFTGTLAERMPPRDYQADAVANFLRHYAAGERHMLYRLATGCGKTYTAALTAEQWLAADPERRRVMVMAYERGLVNQFRDELIDFLGIEVGLEMGDDGAVSPGHLPPITVASRQTLYVDDQDRSRLYKFDPERYDWLVIPDECHGWKYGLPSCRHIVDWFEKNPESAWLGLTATPERGDGVSLARLFGTVCCELRLSDAIGQGYLVPLRQHYAMIDGIDFRNLREVAGDFDDGELDEVLSRRESLMQLAAPLLGTRPDAGDPVGNRRTLVFCPGVECARSLARTINAEIDHHGLAKGRAESMDGSTPDAIRQDIIARHQAGQFQFLVVCSLCRAGYNDPGIGCVAVYRPTKSRVMAEQMKGRGIRTLRGTLKPGMTADERIAAIASSAKPDCLVVDLVGVSGMPEVASTAHLLASGEPDDVIERANKRQVDGEQETVDESIRKAKAEIDEERERARQERLERERREQEQAAKQARIEVDVRYTLREISGPADGGAPADIGRVQLRATEGQVALLVHKYGVSEAKARGFTRRQAGAVLDSYRKKSASRTTPYQPQTNPSDPPTSRQISVLQRHRRPVPKTFGEAVNLIKDINRELAS